ncbi:hypothetical protein ACFLSQ_03585 [Bacteroidota bacterium]
MKNIYNIFTVILFFVTISCQDGLAPKNTEDIQTKSYISGMIKYVGGINRFPDSSKVFGIYVVAFKEYPKDSSGIIAEILKGNAFLKFESQPYPVDSSEFSIEFSEPPVNIEYIVVAMQTDSSIESQMAIGVFTETGDNTKPTEILIEKGKTYYIDITVDFDNLPPQPF